MRARNRRTGSPTPVRYVRSGFRQATAGAVQEWKSDLTGRSYEVFEMNSYGETESLSEGSTGYLQYRNGTAFVTRNLDDPAPDHLKSGKTVPVGGAEHVSNPPRIFRQWSALAMMTILLGFVLWHLVRF